MFWLDTTAALLCALIMFSLIVIHILSSRHIGGLDLPPYVRNGFFVAAVALCQRSLDFAFLAADPHRANSLGHIDVWGLMTSAAMAWAMGSFAWCVFTRRATAKTDEMAAERHDFWSRFHF